MCQGVVATYEMEEVGSIRSICREKAWKQTESKDDDEKFSLCGSLRCCPTREASSLIIVPAASIADVVRGNVVVAVENEPVGYDVAVVGCDVDWRE